MARARLPEFLDRAGGLGLLILLEEESRGFSELEAEIDASSDTLSVRIDEAVDIGLVASRRREDRGRTVADFYLTEMGETVVRRLKKDGVVRSYHAMRSHQQQIEEGTKATLKWFKEHPAQIFNFREAREHTLLYEDEEVASDYFGLDDPEEVPLIVQEMTGSDEGTPESGPDPSYGVDEETWEVKESETTEADDSVEIDTDTEGDSDDDTGDGTQ